MIDSVIARRSSALSMISAAFIVILPLLSLTTTSLQVQQVHPTFPYVHTNSFRNTFSTSPLYFIPTHGQIASDVIFESQLREASVFFTLQEVVLALKNAQLSPNTQEVSSEMPVVRTAFIGTRGAPTIVPLEPQAAHVSIFHGDNSPASQQGIPTYGSVLYQNLYTGIDVRYSGPTGHLKSTYTIASGAHPSQIRWHYTGVKNVAIDTKGSLLITLPSKQTASPLTFAEQPPVAWQIINGKRHSVAVQYDLAADGSVGFALGAYDPAASLVIDPELVFSTFVSGSNFDHANAVATDGQNNIYVVGETSSTDFPIKNAFQTTLRGASDVFVAKYDSAGILLYTTYLGGDNIDKGYDIAVDAAGNTYITGSAGITSFMQNPFPTTPGAFDRVQGPVKAFITKLSPDGSQLVYSTLFGGSSITVGQGIAIDTSGNAYITGEIRGNSLPTKNPFQATYGGGTNDAFVAKFNPTGTDLVYSSYLGGSANDTNLEGRNVGIAVDPTNSVYIAGETTSDAGFPVTQNAFDTTLQGLSDAFVVKVAPSGDHLDYATFLGGTGSPEEAYSVAVNAAGEAYVTGVTTSSDFPTTPGSFQPVRGSATVFVTRLNATGTKLIFSTFYGGSFGYDIALDSAGRASIVGSTQGNLLPTQNPLQGYGGQEDAFVATFSSDGSRLLFSSYIGGSGNDEAYGVANDSSGNLVVVGFTRSGDFPTKNAAQSIFGGSVNNTGNAAGFVMKINAISEGQDLQPNGGSAGNAGSFFPFTATGFQPETQLTITVNGVVVGTLQTAQNGQLKFVISFASTAQPGTYIIAVTGPAPQTMIAADIKVQTTVTIDTALPRLPNPGSSPVLNSQPTLYLPIVIR